MSSTSQFLYRIRPTRSTRLSEGLTPEKAELVSQHFDRLKRLMEKGVLILAERTLNTDESSFGIVIFNAESEDYACAIMESDPAVSGGVFRAELFRIAWC